MEGDSIKTRAGSWNGLRYTGYPKLRPNLVFEYEFVLNEKELSYGFKLLNTSVFSRFVVVPSGVAQRFILNIHISSSLHNYRSGQTED
jgi:hypothetical protein